MRSDFLLVVKSTITTTNNGEVEPKFLCLLNKKLTQSIGHRPKTFKLKVLF